MDAPRALQQRIHRTLAFFLSYTAWQSNADCVVVQREDLLRYLGLERALRDARKEAFEVDVMAFFPHVKFLDFGERDAFASVYLSRFGFPGTVDWIEVMSDEERASSLCAAGLRTVLISPGLDERRVVEGLALASQGFRLLPPEQNRVD